MKFTILKQTLFDILTEMSQMKTVQEMIQFELDGNSINPNVDLDNFHAKLKERNLTDKLIKSVLKNNAPINQLYGHSALLDYYMIFLGFQIPIGGYDWLKTDDDLMLNYKNRVHTTSYGKIAIKHLYGSNYFFKVKVAEAVERWLFSKWKFFPDEQALKPADALLLRAQICSIKNARLVIDLALLKKIFEFNSKDFFYNKEIIEFLSSYRFEIQKFEENLVENITYIGCEYRRRLDDCYELIFS